MDLATPRREARLGPRQRRALVASAVVLLLGASLWAWWTLQLWGLPDIGDPFDVAAFQNVRVPDDRNAFFEYCQAEALHKPIARKIARLANQSEQGVKDFYSTHPTSWPDAPPIWRDYLAQSTEVLRIWRIGTDKPDAFYHNLDRLSFRTPTSLVWSVSRITPLAILEGSRLETEGDLAGAWGWYRAALRSSRHLGWHGYQDERICGILTHNKVTQAITRWAANPRVDAPLLRQALDEVIAIDGLTVPRSETLKAEYLVFVHALDDPDLIDHVLKRGLFRDEAADWSDRLPMSFANKEPIQATRIFLARDRERSLRLARLLTANGMVEIDKPPSQRSKLFRSEPPIYEASPGSTGLSASELSSWLDSSLLARRNFRMLNRYAESYDRERNRQARLVVHLATELYRREHGKAPGSPEAVVGPYLEALPEGYDSIEKPAKAR